MEMTDRKKQILKIVTEGYIQSAEPIGSKTVVERMPGKISSATVRNELADLEEMGYLEQPHTSAGRIPSAKGYRLYVNELMEHKTVTSEEAEKITSALGGRMQQIDQVVARAGQMASTLVGYPAYAVADHKQAVTVRRFELIAVSSDSFIAVVMLSDSRVKSQLMHLQLLVEEEHLRQISHLLNTHFTGISAPEMNGHLMNLSDQVEGQWFLLLNQVVDYAGELLTQAQTQQVFTGGASQILKFPEYRDADKAHELMSFISDSKEDLPVPVGGAPMQILIGPENVNDALKDSSVVIASYDIGENMRGLVGVVGPTRMDYATVAARLSYFAESLSRMFEKPRELPPGEENKKRVKKRKRIWSSRSRPPRRPLRRLRQRKRRRCRRWRRPSPSAGSRWSSSRVWQSSSATATINIFAWPPSTTTIASAPPRRRRASIPMPSWTP